MQFPRDIASHAIHRVLQSYDKAMGLFYIPEHHRTTWKDRPTSTKQKPISHYKYITFALLYNSLEKSRQ